MATSSIATDEQRKSHDHRSCLLITPVKSLCNCSNGRLQSFTVGGCLQAGQVQSAADCCTLWWLVAVPPAWSLRASSLTSSGKTYTESIPTEQPTSSMMLPVQPLVAPQRDKHCHQHDRSTIYGSHLMAFAAMQASSPISAFLLVFMSCFQPVPTDPHQSP